MMRFRKWLCVIMALIAVLWSFAGCGTGQEDNIGSGGETRLSDLSGTKIGVMTGSIQSVMMP